MNNFKQHITQPLPYVKRRWMIVLLVTLWIFLLAIILKPFGFRTHASKMWITLVYTSIATVSCAFVVYVFPLSFRTYFSPPKFTNGKFYLACISIIAIATILSCIVTYYIAMIEKSEIAYSTIERFFLWFVTISFIALFPMMIVYTSLRHTRSKIILQELENDLESELSQLSRDGNTIVLGGNTKIPLRLSLNELLYIEASGNSVMAHYTKNGNIKQKQFRESLGRIMDDCKDYPQIVRCHRSFVVNIENVTSLDNVIDNELIVSATNAKIPISRSCTKEVREKLSN